MQVAELEQQFQEIYAALPRLFAAPGRVNLIGEHTDYHEGYVLPMAIHHQTVVAAAARQDSRVRVRSLTVDQSHEFDLGKTGQPERGSWMSYVEGMARTLAQKHHRLTGADLLITSDVPIGAGVSSSAALEMAVGMALLGLSGERDPDRLDLALAGRQVEHGYVGTECGIMDQYISAFGRAGHALLIDCRSLSARQVPVDTSRTSVVICDSGVKHELASSGYNERRAQCRDALRILQKQVLELSTLRDLDAETLERHRSRLSSTQYRRCRHVVTENARTLAAADALGAGDMAAFGQLMVESHESLREDYEVTCPELDYLVDDAVARPGVYGSRMTGGGFGGSTVTLVEKDHAEAFCVAASAAYERRFGRPLRLFVTQASEGAREIVKSVAAAGGEPAERVSVKQSRVLVTGGAGYVGSVVVEELLRAGCERVVVLDDLSTGHREAVTDGAELVVGDIGDVGRVSALLEQHRIDSVVHMAASSLVGESVTLPEKYFENNVGKGIDLLQAMLRAGVRRLVFSSTAAVYGQPVESPITEDFPTSVLNPYGETKLCFERALRWYSRAHGFKYASLRYFNAAGATARCGEARAHETHLIPLVLQVALGKRDKLLVFGDDYPTGDGTCVRDYVHVSDLACAHVLALEQMDLKSGIYNLGSGSGYSVTQVLEAAREVTGRKIRAEIAPRRPGDPAVLVASAERAQKLLGWKPERQDVRGIIDDAWQWLLRHPQGYSRAV